MNPALRRLTTVLASAALLLGLPALAPFALVPTLLPPAAAATAVEPYASYDGQSTCASEVLPGTDFLLRHLVRTHPGTRYASTLRACTEGTSEHKDGRALDWGVDVAVPAERAAAEAWIAGILATDRQGNAHALARRMGIMYLIWDDHIWRAYRGFRKELYTRCEPRSECSKTDRHRDHVHISLSRAGAAAQTSFYRMRGVDSVPVLYPGTRQLDPVSTAEVTFDVPADGRTLTTDFKLVRGTTYRVVADGLYRAGSGSLVADAACRWVDGAWRVSGRLLLDGVSPWGECDPGHTYDVSYTPTRTGFLDVRVAENTPRDAEGSLTFSILREDLRASTVVTRRVPGSAEPRPARRPGASARALVDEQLTVRASSSAGARTARALRLRNRYRVVVTGTAASGETVFDGSCVRYAGRLRPRHTLDLTTPDADHLSLFVQGVRVALRPVGTSDPCDARTNRYVGVLKPVVNGRSRVKVWDPYTYADNRGVLTVRLLRR